MKLMDVSLFVVYLFALIFIPEVQDEANNMLVVDCCFPSPSVTGPVSLLHHPYPLPVSHPCCPVLSQSRQISLTSLSVARLFVPCVQPTLTDSLQASSLNSLSVNYLLQFSHSSLVCIVHLRIFSHSVMCVHLNFLLLFPLIVTVFETHR